MNTTTHATYTGRPMNLHEVEAAIQFPWRFEGISPQLTLDGSHTGRWVWQARCARLHHRYNATPLLARSGEELLEKIRDLEEARRASGDGECPVRRWGVYVDRGGWGQAWASLPGGIERIRTRALTPERALDKLRVHCLHSGYVLPPNRRDEGR